MTTNTEPAYAPPAPPTPPAKGLAIAALVVGIVAFLVGLVPILGIIVGLAGVILGIIALVKKQPKAFALTGLILAAIALIVSSVVTAGLGAAVDTISKEIEKAEVTQEPVEEPAEAEETEVVEEEPAEPEVPAEYKAALNKADIYANSMHMSKAGLYEQLTADMGEKFSAEAAQYAVDNVKTDWKENALQKAITYQDSMSMSPDAIYDQLVAEMGEQFTTEEADYAIANLPQ